MTHAVFVAAIICVAAAAAEGVLAGSGVRQRFQELRLPAAAPPMWLWVLIGAGYYAIAFTILIRLQIVERTAPTRAAFVLLLVVLLANAIWNYVFFRAKKLAATLILSVCYSVCVLALQILLVTSDRVSASVLLPYTLYLGYANWLQNELWRLNR
ncbi:MAG TPA: tryptophan-rich sensory protein [Thermoanaerobaculia bacterium]|jgi:tryptophan-rich sensory protein|nr:tryptophan-rich sensory protein [Thermoanaerobaculia bacterium]